MTRFIVRRLWQSMVLLVIILAGVFFLVHLTPGGPESALLGNPRLGPDEMQHLRERFGLDQPLPAQYLHWMANALRLDFGRSYFYARPATDLVLERLGPTVQLGLFSYAIALIGVPLGALAAVYRGRPADAIVRFVTTVAAAAPTWWLGLASIVIINSLTGWLPNGQGRASPVEWLKYIIVPAVLLGLSGLVSFIRLVRASMLDALGADFVRTARGKGLPASLVIQRHVLPHALAPVITLLGGLLPGVLSGALITEYVFAWPGVGLLFYEAASSRDYPVVLAILTMIMFATLLGNLLADVAYGLVDPRVRYA